MASTTRDPQTYDFQLDDRTYRVRFEYVHAYVLEENGEFPLMLYLMKKVPQALHPSFLKCVTYLRKEFAIHDT